MRRALGALATAGVLAAAPARSAEPPGLAARPVAAHGRDAPVRSEAHRTLAAELRVMRGDLRRLAAPGVAPREAAGLRARLAGALASLPLTLREAGADAATLGALRAAHAAGDDARMAGELDRLGAAHPLVSDIATTRAPTPAQASVAAAIHREACAGCHDAGAGDPALPARDLHADARTMSGAEFAARLLVGVRGNRSTAWRNPFTEPELAALAAWYRHARPGADRTDAPGSGASSSTRDLSDGAVERRTSASTRSAGAPAR